MTTSQRLRMLVAAALMLAAPVLIAACGGGDGGGGKVEVAQGGKPSGEVTISNWPGYIDPGKDGTVAEFEKADGVDVNYIEDINSNTQFFGKLQPLLANGDSGGRSLFVVTNWLAKQMYDLGYLEQLDHADLKTVFQNINPQFVDDETDPGRKFSIPWQGGLTGIWVNTSEAPDIRSLQDLFDPKYKGKVTVLDEMRDTVPLVMQMQGADPNNFTTQDWEKAIDFLKQETDSGQIRRFTGNDYVQDLNAGNIVACQAWSGDVLALQADNPDIKFVVPEEGLAIWSDNMLVPNKATHKANAEALMNYYYDPEVAATLAAWVNYICPVEGAQQAMEKIDPELVDSPLIFPDSATLEKSSAFMALDTAKAKLYETDFNLAIGG